jgi:hypothetical protein
MNLLYKDENLFNEEEIKIMENILKNQSLSQKVT